MEQLPIPGYPGYLATSDGGIIGKRGNPMHPNPCPKTGYLGVTVHVNGKQGRLLVHRGVCLAFHGLPYEGQEVAHKNGIRTDNRPANVRWKSRKQNAEERVLHGTQVVGEGHPLAKLTAEDVIEIRRMYAAGGYRMSDLACLFGVSASKVCQVINRQSWKHVEESKH